MLSSAGVFVDVPTWPVKGTAFRKAERCRKRPRVPYGLLSPGVFLAYWSWSQRSFLYSRKHEQTDTQEGRTRHNELLHKDLDLGLCPRLGRQPCPPSGADLVV